jgi:aminoglycoside phosphotransferase
VQSNDDDKLTEVLAWCASVLGPFEVVSDASREHAGRRAAAHRLRISSGGCYVKIHRDRSHWENEVHAYEQWAPAFGDFSPRLLAVRAEEPLALVISELPGSVLEEVQLTPSQGRAVWRSAGQALAAFHNLAVGEYFGACRRDGTCAGRLVSDARQYVSDIIEEQVQRGLKGGFLSENELAVVRAALDLLPAFEGERPVPCHRDYCPANWLVSRAAIWTGVIDFEFAGWDVRTSDFTRYPNWDWIDRPDLAEAFFEGYGRSLTPKEEQQRLLAHTLYTLSAVVWGMENSYFGFAADGRQALKHLGKLLG